MLREMGGDRQSGVGRGKIGTLIWHTHKNHGLCAAIAWLGKFVWVAWFVTVSRMGNPGQGGSLR